MPLTKPRVTTKSDWVIMEFDVPEADVKAFLVSMSGERLYISGKYSADVRGLKFAMYPQGGSRFKSDFKIPVPVTGNSKYCQATYDEGVLHVSIRRASEYSEGTVKIYVK